MKTNAWCIGALAGCLLSMPVFGVTWSGYSTDLPGTSLAERPELAGSVIASQTFTFHAYPPDPSAPLVTLDNWVVREASTGTLDFYYQFNNPNVFQVTIGGPNVLIGFDLGPSLDMDRRMDLGAQNDAISAARGVEGVYLGQPRTGAWLFDPNSFLDPIFVHTSATDYQSTGSIIVSGSPITDLGFVPIAVPEPTTLATFSLAMIALTRRTRRRSS